MHTSRLNVKIVFWPFSLLCLLHSFNSTKCCCETWVDSFQENYAAQNVKVNIWAKSCDIMTTYPTTSSNIPRWRKVPSAVSNHIRSSPHLSAPWREDLVHHRSVNHPKTNDLNNSDIHHPGDPTLTLHSPASRHIPMHRGKWQNWWSAKRDLHKIYRRWNWRRIWQNLMCYTEKDPLSVRIPKGTLHRSHSKPLQPEEWVKSISAEHPVFWRTHFISTIWSRGIMCSGYDWYLTRIWSLNPNHKSQFNA